MPELPEVETVRRGLIPVMENKRVERIVLNREDLRVPFGDDFAPSLEGRILKTLTRRGKYIIAEFEHGRCFVLHLGMSGRIAIHPRAKDYVPVKHDHALFYFDDHCLIVLNDPRRFGMLYLCGANWANEEPFSKMGPEPLHNDFSGPVLFAALQYKRTPVKIALLDQRVVSGVGNIYACEALYDARIHPARKACSLSLDDCERLVPAIRNVLMRAINSGGSSLRDYKQTDGSMGYFQHEFHVYDLAGEVCKRATGEGLDPDKHTVERIIQSNRSSFYCPGCQKI